MPDAVPVCNRGWGIVMIPTNYFRFEEGGSGSNWGRWVSTVTGGSVTGRDQSSGPADRDLFCRGIRLNNQLLLFDHEPLLVRETNNKS